MATTTSEYLGLTIEDNNEYVGIETTAENFQIIDEACERIETNCGTNLNNHKNNTSNPHSVTKAQVGLGNVANYAPDDIPVSFTAETSVTELTSGTSLKTLFGKLSKAVSSLIAHIGNTSNPHGVTYQQAGAAASNHNHGASEITSGVLSVSRGGTGQSSTSSIKSSFGITALETSVNSLSTSVNGHTGNTSNPHSVTAAQVGAPTTTEFNTHKNSKSNPHGVTATQVGAPTTATFNSHANSTSNPHSVTCEQISAAKSADLLTHTTNKSNPHGVTCIQIGAVSHRGLVTSLNTWYNSMINTEWSSLTLDEGVTAHTYGGSATPKYRFVNDFIEFCGSIKCTKSGTSNVVIATLPSDYAPSDHCYFECVCGASPYALARIIIRGKGKTNEGRIEVQRMYDPKTGADITTNAWIQLNNIRIPFPHN